MYHNAHLDSLLSRRHLLGLKAGVSSVTALVQEGVGNVEGMDGSQSEGENSGIGCERRN